MGHPGPALTQSILSMCSSRRLERRLSMPSCVRSDWMAVAREKLGCGIASCEATRRHEGFSQSGCEQSGGDCAESAGTC
jgi:hypothetical protein